MVVAADEVLYEEELNLKQRFLEEPLTLALGESLFPNELPTGERPIQIELSGLPSEWPGLLGVERLYLGRMNPNGLSRAQWQALIRWVEWGAITGIFRILLFPLTPAGMGQWGSWPIVLGEPRGEVLYQDGLPILIAGRRGRGRVIFSTVNPLDAVLALSARSDISQAGVNTGEGYLWQALPAERGGHRYDVDYLRERDEIRASWPERTVRSSHQEERSC